MSKWRHSICDACWIRMRGPDDQPVRLVPDIRSEENCCVCAKTHKSGIYFREDPDVLSCGGTRGTAHAEDAQ